jgi:hypothetical protein
MNSLLASRFLQKLLLENSTICESLKLNLTIEILFAHPQHSPKELTISSLCN